MGYKMLTMWLLRLRKYILICFSFNTFKFKHRSSIQLLLENVMVRIIACPPNVPILEFGLGGDWMSPSSSHVGTWLHCKDVK